MTIIQKLRALLVICQVAHRQGITYRQCYSYMAEAIEAAWATSDPEAKQRQVELVGEGKVPTPEEFIVLAAGQL